MIAAAIISLRYADAHNMLIFMPQHGLRYAITLLLRHIIMPLL